MVFRCDELLPSYEKYNQVKDQWENVGSHTQKGINFLEQYSHFLKDRCQVESDYARSLRRLVKTYTPRKKDEYDIQFSFVRAFRDVLNETGDFAGQHEMIAENLITSVNQEVQALIKENKDERKRLLTEGAKFQQQLQHSLQQLEKAKKGYEKAYKESEKAQDNYQKADADYNLSRAEVEKQRNNASYKSQQCEEQKNEYANQLIKTNQLQTSHYDSLMPHIFQQLQDMDEKRTTNFKMFLKKSVDVEQSVFPIINKCLDGVVQAADSIKESEDSELVIEKYKSGFTPPVDIPFDDLSAPRENGDLTPLHPATRSETMKGTISASKLKKRVGLFSIFGNTSKTNTSFCEKDNYSDLPPNQRRKKITAKITEVTNKLNQENKSREGLEKMKQVYTNNSSLGDPETITGQLSDSTQTIDKLQSELEKYMTMLHEAEKEFQARGTASGGPNTPTAAAFGRHSNGIAASSPRSSLASQRTSLSDESLSRSASDSSVYANSLPTTANQPPSMYHEPTFIASGAPLSQLSSTPTGHSSTVSAMGATPTSTMGSSRALNVASTGRDSPAVSSGKVSPASSNSTIPVGITHITPPAASPLRDTGLGSTSTMTINRTPISTYHSKRAMPAGSFLHANRYHSPICNSFAPTVHSNASNNKPAVVNTVGSSHSPESGIGLSHNSLHGSDSYSQPDGHNEQGQLYNMETQPVIGSCEAIYPFQGFATSDGSMEIVVGEKLFLLEMDQGDGWSRVRRTDVCEEGFVPTSYLEIELHNAC